MFHHLLSLGLCCSMLIHGLILLTFCCSIGLRTPLADSNIKKEEEKPISLFSLSSFEQTENQPKTPEKELFKESDETTLYEPIDLETRESTIKPAIIDEENKPEEPAEPQEIIQDRPLENHPLEQVAEQAEKIPAIEESKPAMITDAEKKELSRSLFLKEATSNTQTTTRTDFFQHAKSIAQTLPLTSLHSTNRGNFSAKISGLGNLKYHSYEEKVRNALITAFNTVKHRFHPSNEKGLSAVRTAIDLVINKDGSILQLYLVHSSGDTSFDKMIMESIKYAAPFPSIPNHLGIDKYRLGGMELHVQY
ncbi:TonB C-terminal domain-containing protein [Candidatus Babeliales bacterium]|nr:TonB C-terminal domain-containing protein [Candidatus Babeliales bacterium]